MNRAIMDVARDEAGRRSRTALPATGVMDDYRLLPARFEFWERRSDRFHDRFEYELNDADPTWVVTRLWP